MGSLSFDRFTLLRFRHLSRIRAWPVLGAGCGKPDAVGGVNRDGVRGMFPSRGRGFSGCVAVVALGGLLLAVLCAGPVEAQEEATAKSAPAAKGAGDGGVKEGAETNDAVTGEGEAEAGPGLSDMLIPIVGMGLIFYFIVLAPQKKARKKQQTVVDALKKHDRVVTIGGIVGTIVSIDTANEEVVLEVGPDTQLRILRRSIQGPKPFGSDDEGESGEKK
jgi:preprotein translocase subunit YajC